MLRYICICKNSFFYLFKRIYYLEYSCISLFVEYVILAGLWMYTLKILLPLLYSRCSKSPFYIQSILFKERVAVIHHSTNVVAKNFKKEVEDPVELSLGIITPDWSTGFILEAFSTRGHDCKAVDIVFFLDILSTESREFNAGCCFIYFFSSRILLFITLYA